MAAMSGGVDSSVAAHLLKEQGHTVVGATMTLVSHDTPGSYEGACCSLESVKDAQRVCQKLDIPHHVFNFRDLFRQTVIEDFYREYQHGRTPNPCVICNAEIKWKALLKKAEILNCDFIATGHYAQIVKNEDGVFIRKGEDPAKEQTYFLWSISPSALEKTLFPVGAYEKKEIRKIAAGLELPVAEKTESQEVCFVPDQDYQQFFKDAAAARGESFSPGEIIDQSGNAVGTHNGIHLYTIGQRKGIGAHDSRKQYVTGIDPIKNRVIIGDDENLFSRDFSANQINWFGSRPSLNTEMNCGIRVRYRQAEQPGNIRFTEEGISAEFFEPQRAITPGQSAVFYKDDVMLGGGIIRE